MHTIFSYIKSHVVIATTLIILAVAVAAITGRMAASKKNVPVSDSNTKQVTLVPASTFRTGRTTITADGVVESLSQVDLKSQMSAPISNVLVTIGSTVGAGQIIVELQNADIRAQLKQAEASLALAKGQQSNSQGSLDVARRTALEKIRDSYASGLQIMNTNYDGIGDVILLSRSVSSPEINDKIVTAYIDFRVLQPKWKTAVDALNSSSSNEKLLEALSISRSNLNLITTMLDNVLLGLNQSSSNVPTSATVSINAWKAAVSTQRASASAVMSSLTSIEGNLTSTLTGYSVSSEAQISLAEAGVQNLQAQLAKTIIRSPINGKVAALPLRTGELATPGQLIATIVGSGGLQIKAYASGEDFDRIQKGAKVLIEGKIPGIVMSVAPSVNQSSKKVEVNITVTNSQSSNLVIGQSVQAVIDAKTTAPSLTSKSTYLFPMQNVKIIPGAAYVLTVDEQSKVKMNTVELGEVRGEFVEIVNGLTDDMSIISPVYELSEGEVVKVQ